MIPPGDRSPSSRRSSSASRDSAPRSSTATSFAWCGASPVGISNIDLDRRGAIGRFLRLTYLGSIDKWCWASFTNGKYRPWHHNYTAPLQNPPPVGGLEAPGRLGRDPATTMPEAEGSIEDAIEAALEIRRR